MNRGFIFILLLLASQLMARGQEGKPALKDMTVEEYIKKFAPIASEEMKKSGIPASITLAQGILESSSGNSELARNANNHFGIKCHNDWTGKGYLKDDETKKECFRVYETPEESFVDHVNFLKNRSNYAFLFQLNPTDYKGWAKGLKNAGYATNPDYPVLLIRIIEDHKLFDYDKQQKQQELAKAPLNTNDSVEAYKDKVVMFNNIKSVIVQPGETLNDIAIKNNVTESFLMTYNDLGEADTDLVTGSRIYLQPKRFRGINKNHVVKKGDNMHSISQDEGIKLWWLYHKNHMKWGEEPAFGETLALKQAASGAPKLRSEDAIEQEIADEIDAHQRDLRTQYEKQRADSLAALKPAASSEQAAPDEWSTIKVAGESDKNTGIPAQSNTYFANSIHTVGDTMPLKFHDDGLSMSVIVNQDDKAPSRDYHIVKQGETLFSIAQMYYTRVDSLQKWNSLAGPINVGQEIIVGFGEIPEPKSPEIINPPAPTMQQPSVIKPDASQVYYIVKAGEGLYGIAKQHNVTTEQIRQWNSLQSDNLKIGQKLIVSANASPSAGKSNHSPSTAYHLVAAHETLFSIARQYGVTVKQLKTWNNLSDDGVKIGQKLVVGQ